MENDQLERESGRRRSEAYQGAERRCDKMKLTVKALNA